MNKNSTPSPPLKKKLVAALDDLVEPLNEILSLLYIFTRYFKILFIAIGCLTLFSFYHAYRFHVLIADMEVLAQKYAKTAKLLKEVAKTTKKTEATVDRADKGAKINLRPVDAGVESGSNNAVLVIETGESASVADAGDASSGVSSEVPTPTSRVTVEIPVKLPRGDKIKVLPSPGELTQRNVPKPGDKK
jgi:hypothetical protein